MAAAVQRNSTDFYVTIGGTKVAYGIDATVSLTQAIRDVTTKDSSGYGERGEGLREWSISGGSLYVDGANGLSALVSAYDDRGCPVVVWGDGTKVISGSAFLESLEANSPGSEDNVSYSYSFLGTGDPTVSI